MGVFCTFKSANGNFSQEKLASRSHRKARAVSRSSYARAVVWQIVCRGCKTFPTALTLVWKRMWRGVERHVERISKSKLVSWCFEPSQQHRITSGLNTNFSLSPSYSFHRSLYHKSLFFSQTTPQILFQSSERKTGKTNTCFGAYLYSTSTQRGNLHPAGWPILFCGPTQEPVLATANTGKTWERFWKKCRWMDRKGRYRQGRNPWQ